MRDWVVQVWGAQGYVTLVVTAMSDIDAVATAKSLFPTIDTNSIHNVEEITR